jgi:myo-inositol-1(or 4)-monophosphatase
MAGRHAAELAVAAAAARAAGQVLREYREGGFAVREKADRTLVTDADLAAEAAILGHLRGAFPADALLAEESAPETAPEGRCWIVDPLDGTTNFSRGLPQFCVSIALWEDGAPVVAALYLPVLDELFTATADGAARLNGRELRVSATEQLSEAMVNVYFDRRDGLEEGLRVFARVARACEGRVKVMGSTAALLCYVAAGRLDAFVRTTTRIWDFAAGALVLERAGGRVTDFGGAPLRRTGQSLLATNGRLHEALASVLGSPDCRG